MKTALLYRARFKKIHEYVATEVGDFNADVISSNGDELVEYEVKTSKQDLKREIYKAKHKTYNNPKTRAFWVPHRFYFCVPPELVDAATDFIEEHKLSKYGIAVYYKDKHVSAAIEIVRKARRLRETALNEKVIRKIQLRTTSDLVNIYYKTSIEDKMLSTLSSISENNIRLLGDES